MNNIEQFLELIKSKIESLDPVPQKYLVSKGNNNGFEILVADIIETISPQLKFKMHFGHHFPDLTVWINNQKYGIELKSRNNGTWVTNGNSVLESISDDGYEMIYILFGTSNTKIGTPTIKVRYAEYWTVTSSINVTHSPRFKINMNTNESVFESKEQYNALRTYSIEEKIDFLQEYLQENTDGVKWFSSPKQTIMPTPLNALPKKRREQILSEVVILYPQDFIRQSQCEYSRGSEYIIATHYCYSSSFRDFFSAGGRWAYNQKILLPKILKVLHTHRSSILNTLKEANDDFKELAYNSWEALPITLNKVDFNHDFKKVLDYLGTDQINNYLKQVNNKSLYDFLFN